eukprot:98597_1
MTTSNKRSSADNDSHSNWPFRCPHTFSSSPNGFPELIVSTLFYSHKESKKIDDQVKKLWQLLDHNLLCNHCINTLLSTISLEDVINHQIKYSEHKPYSALCVIELLFSLLSHPKIPKILARSCNLNQQSYDREMDLMAHAKETIGKVFMHTVQPVSCICLNLCMLFETQSQKLLFWLKAFYLSMKYWNPYQRNFFTNHYFPRLAKFYIKHHNAFKKMDNYDIIIKLLGLILQNVSSEISTKQIYTHRNVKESRKWAKLLFIESTSCGWVRCDLRQCEEKQLKLCKGCKMSYYCSKSCQKKSWNTYHKKECNRLSNYYGYI